ncbi:MAG: helix-turn-helix domain-containing protein [Kastovskya adunca ATA6-11-RM4]|jgi:DNA-binding Xre family transcriptional regulator/molecular chaperone GrpE (heat shock protein)|nr:helix-turn-helix domain-containing protein [Kastovskya adunca ATA6-11-RM4]
MTVSFHPDYTHQLQHLMQQVGVSSFKALSQRSGVSERQLRRLRRGEVAQLRTETLLQLSEALQVPLTQLLASFSPEASPSIAVEKETSASLAQLRQEYSRLQAQLEEQREALQQEFQRSSLQVLESWLMQWPTVAAAVKKKPELEAKILLPLVEPVERLVQSWGVEAIASVGAEIPYDPQWHQLMEGTAQLGERVRVRYTGYRQGEKLLFRAKVSPVDDIKNT